jgi:hypothetical protein
MFHLKSILTITKLGEPNATTRENIKKILHKIRTITTSLRFLIQIDELDSPEETEFKEEQLSNLLGNLEEEVFSPYIDPESRKASYTQDTELAGLVLQLAKNSEKKINTAISNLSKSMHNLKLNLEKNAVINLGDGLTGYTNAANAVELEAQYINEATMHYFDPCHQKRTEKIAENAHAFYNGHTSGNSTVINANNMTAGELIIASLEALRCIYLLQAPLKENEEKITWGNANISLRRKPSLPNRGNLFIRNVGRYGFKSEDEKNTKKDVLDIFTDIIAYSTEYKFNTVIAQFGHNPEKITLAMLNLPNNKTGTELLAKLRQHLFLIFCAEILRYFPMEGIDDAALPPVKKTPFAMALAIGIELLETGELELTDLFEKDADYGPATGTAILKKYNPIHEKINNLLNKYQENLKASYQTANLFLTAYPQGRIVLEKSDYLAQLSATFGDNLKENKKYLY